MKQTFLFVPRSTHNTRTQCEHHAELLNVKPGGM